jgi:hypothetical protein
LVKTIYLSELKLKTTVQPDGLFKPELLSKGVQIITLLFKNSNKLSSRTWTGFFIHKCSDQNHIAVKYFKPQHAGSKGREIKMIREQGTGTKVWELSSVELRSPEL